MLRPQSWFCAVGAHGKAQGLNPDHVHERLVLYLLHHLSHIHSSLLGVNNTTVLHNLALKIRQDHYTLSSQYYICSPMKVPSNAD